MVKWIHANLPHSSRLWHILPKSFAPLASLMFLIVQESERLLPINLQKYVILWWSRHFLRKTQCIHDIHTFSSVFYADRKTCAYQWLNWSDAFCKASRKHLAWTDLIGRWTGTLPSLTFSGTSHAEGFLPSDAVQFLAPLLHRERITQPIPQTVQ